MSRWRLLETWDRDLPGLSDEQLFDRLCLAREYEAASERQHGAGKARRDWRLRREAVEVEQERRQS